MLISSLLSCSLVEGLNQSASAAPGSAQSWIDPASFHSYCFPNNCLLADHLSPQRFDLKFPSLQSHNPALPCFISLRALTSLGMISLSFQVTSGRFLPKRVGIFSVCLTDASSLGHLIVIPSNSPLNEWTGYEHRGLFNYLNNFTLLFKSSTPVLHPTRWVGRQVQVQVKPRCYGVTICASFKFMCCDDTQWQGLVTILQVPEDGALVNEMNVLVEDRLNRDQLQTPM